jgi:hypothetical protein
LFGGQMKLAGVKTPAVFVLVVEISSANFN